MNAVSHCCVKANFIKAAKDHWVPCEVRLLTDDTDTFLCIKSRPLGFGQTEEDIKSIFSGVSATGTISSTSNPTQLSSVTPVTRAFTALCNLSEYKSCTVVTVSINDVGYFALKLVPAGIFGNKRLYLAMSGETEATTWMSMIKANLGKRKKAAKNPLTQSRDSLVGTLRPSDSQDTLRGDSSANVNNRYDLDIDTIDNEVYEPCSAQDLIPAIIQQRGDWEKLRLSKMDCFLRLTDDRLELLDHNGERVLHWFPYLLIRRFGAVGGVLRIDAGRRCSTGDGRFFFMCSPSNNQPVDAIVSQIRHLALEAKQRLRQEQAARQQMLQQHQEHCFIAEMGSSGAADQLPPPVPLKGSPDLGSAKSFSKMGNRSPSPKGNWRGTINPGGNDSGKGSSNGGWWTSGNFKRASSTPVRRQVEEILDKTVSQKEGEEVQGNCLPSGATDSAISLQKPMEKAVGNNNGVFIASPGKAIAAQLKTNGQLQSKEPTPVTPTAEVKEATSNGIAHQLRLYDNVPTSESGEKAGEKDTQGTEGRHPGSGLGPPSTRVQRSEDTNLPPAPPPPTTPLLLPRQHREANTSAITITNALEGDESRSGNSVRYNGATVINNTPPSVVPKSFVNYSPKTSDLASYRQTSLESPRHSWMTGMSSMRAYRPYRGETPREGGETEVTSGLLRSVYKSPPGKSLSFGSGVYESEERSPTDLVRLNMRGLDEVLQELRDANQNVTSAVQAAERQRQVHGCSTPHHLHQQSRPSTLTRTTSPAPTWSIKRDI
uniref:Docking protein 3 n=1 Tax=Echinococcus granulosus TaxID=6210 RepID=A0A068W859_ECHGR|nr:docking protein 3 [Echinococcus granulosus]